MSISGITDYTPIDVKTYINQIRKLLPVLPENAKLYEGAQINMVESKTVAGKEWFMFKILTLSGFKQEMWSRNISPLQVISIAYSGIGEPFDQYHGDFDRILEKASGL